MERILMEGELTDIQILAEALAEEVVFRKRLERDNRALRGEVKRLSNGGQPNVTVLERTDTAGPEGN